MNVHKGAIRWLMLAIVILTFSAASFSQVAVGISVRVGPPPLPVYAQPICPGPGYLWTPGYWAWDDDEGYYWVPGTWVVAPVGLLWTPGYWGWGNGFYLWHAGYWGPHIGFYGGINYGFGYTGEGFHGGEWRGRQFYYNRSVTNVSVTNVTNVYNRTVIVNNNRTVSYNGGRGGVEARPTRQDEYAMHERHQAPLPMQGQHEHMARENRQNFARENHGRPAIAATTRPADFSSRAAIPARAAGGAYHPPAIPPREARGPSTPGNRGNSRDGYRPFTPPSRSESAGSGARETRNNPRNATPVRGTEARSQSHPMEARPNDSRPQNRPTQASPYQNRPPQNRQTESRPQNERNMYHSAAPPRENAPRQNSRPSGPPPNRQSPPKDDHQKGR
jgi:hypothetical protein